ncbi:MAG: PilT/PilU family type 4a pilus ATPase [Planctomycetota bacterium]
MGSINFKMEELLKNLAEMEGGSDLIVTEGKPPLLRVHTEISPIEGYPVLSGDDTEGLIRPLMTPEQAERFKEDKQLDMSLVLKDIGRFRVNIYRQCGYTGFVARVIYEKLPTFEQLQLPEILLRFALLPRGLVLITGPIGSGKSTTISTMLNHINNNRSCHIVTVEDPIEYVHKHNLATIDQREVGMDTNSFADALRTVLRQSTDVVVIGEVRDRESAQAAMTLAEIGHLTLATLHTRGVVPSISRLIDMFPREMADQIRVQLSASLAAVVWQQLLPAKQGGLIPACEIMTVIPSIRAMIRHGRLHEIPSIIQSGKKYGMYSMEQYIETLQDKIDEKWIDVNYADLSTAKA